MWRTLLAIARNGLASRCILKCPLLALNGHALSAARRSASSYIFALTIESHSNMQVEFVTIDVFTDRQFGGNPLAVVADGTELSTRQMQAIAAEFNLAETTFVA